MKFKKEYLILIVVIAALVLYLSTRSLNRNGDQLPQPAKLESAKIDRLVVTDKKNASLELVKKDERWFIEPQEYPADGVKVKNMISAISDLTLTALVSESGSYDRYGLTEGDKISVQAFSGGDAVRGFSIGKVAPTYQHTFVLLKGNPNVYHARGQLVRTFDQSVGSLRDKTIFDVDKEGITAVTLKKGDKTLTLNKAQIAKPEPEPDEAKKNDTPAQPPATQWQAPDGQTVDQNVADRLLGEINRLSCESFLPDDAKTNMGDPLWTISFKKGETEQNLSVYPKLDDKADKMPATASTSKYAFLLNQPRIDTIERDMNSLLGIKTADKPKK